MLSESQVGDLWTRRVEAEVRAAYFADLASRYTTQKQWISGLSFILSSAAVVTAWTVASPLAPALPGVVVAALNAYAIAVGLDRKPFEMARLHAQWNELSDSYEELWRDWSDESAPARRSSLLRREREVSEASTHAPYKKRLIKKWAQLLYARYREAEA